MSRIQNKLKKKTMREGQRALLFLLPALAVLGFVSMYPLVQGAVKAFFTRKLGQEYIFVGLENFRLLFQDPLFARAFVNSVIWTVASVTFQFLFSYPLATILNSQYLRLRRLFRALALVPWATPPVVGALMWRYMFSPGGPLNFFLSSLGVSNPPNWLLDPKIALWTCIAANTWMGIPFVTVMILAGLQTIEKELVEAAAIDGATYLRIQWSVILPNIKRVLLIVLTLETIWTFNMFDIVFVLTRGGPGNASLTLPLYAYQNAFWYYQDGFGAAIGVVILTCLLGVVITYIRQVMR